jgi:hypothetical protein
LVPKTHQIKEKKNTVGTEKELGKKLIGGFSIFNVNSRKKWPQNRKNSIIFESTKLENKHCSLI